MGWWWNFTSFVWDLIGEDFFKMIVTIIGEGSLVTILFKARDRKDLGNWCPITL
jgi:hypothetical protein